MKTSTKPRVVVSSTGVHSTSPAEILRSEVGKEIIRRTSEAVAKRTKKASEGSDPKRQSVGAPNC